MAQATTVARPYARAAFEVATAKKDVAAWLDVLADGALLVEQPEIDAYLSNPKVGPEDRLGLLLDIFGERLSAEQSRFLQVLCDAHQARLLPAIFDLFAKAAMAADSAIKAKVTSAQALTEMQKTQLIEALGKRLERTVTCEYELDPALMGGLVVRTDEWVLDGSVKGKLAQLKRTLVG